MKLDCVGCNSFWELQTKSIAHISAPKIFLPSDSYFKLLVSFPDLTTLSNKHKPVKHSVEHHIVTEGYPCSSRPCQLSSEKLEFVKKEIDYLLKSGIGSFRVKRLEIQKCSSLTPSNLLKICQNVVYHNFPGN